MEVDRERHISSTRQSSFLLLRRTVLALAGTTIRGSLRERILYLVLAFGIGLVLLSSILTTLTVGYRIRVVTDVSLSAVNFSGLALCTLLGVTAVRRDIEGRLIYPILAKPIGRSVYILGKHAGVVATTWLNAALMLVLATSLVLFYASAEPEGRLFSWADYSITCLLLLVRLTLVATIAVTLATVSSSTVATIGTIGFSIAGYLSGDLRRFLGMSDSPLLRGFGELIYNVLPDLRMLDTLGLLVHGQVVLSVQLWVGLAYAACYTVGLLTIACVAFARSDLQ